MSLRKRLFLHVGMIFLFVAILSCVLPSYLVDKKISKAGSEIEAVVQRQEQKVNKILSQLLSENFREINTDENKEAALSSLLGQIAQTTQKTVIFLYHNKEPFAFNNQGQRFDLTLEGFSVDELKDEMGKVTWKNTSYNYLKYPVDSGWDSTLIILNPADQEFSVVPILKKMGDAIGEEITVNILLASLLIFAVALLFLSRASKKITEPIVALAKATEEVEKGHYETVVLPDFGKRKDEVEVLSHGFEKMITSLKDREKIRGILSKVVSKEIAAEILQSNIELGGEERLVTVLFCDVRGFTKITENMEPKAVIAMMNTYFSQMCRIIDANEGVVDKFVGDLVMVLYGAPIIKPDSAKKAITTALLMRKNSTLPIGVGIHTGNMVTGNVGSENRLNYTVLGANVNLASRLCSAAKPKQILISESTLNAPYIKDSFEVRELPPIALKGFESPVKVFEIIDFLKIPI